ncbi:hypothetical protein RINTHH_5280 [Richelia intracellularis HH01]|uniref:TerB-C domain-containing protein n=1 Tax=Richelia intracellularis HH01 TaxID=1165094 RepID=M1WZC7_9NOST|nr:hypothetical protein [Richelia intracellularis]CCH66683.1 hypothetical protein RINTHH_5280 [Richelia intracellularis HH01]
MQSAMLSHRFVLGIIALGVSFGLSLALTWDFRDALITGIITITITYTLLFIEHKQNRYEMKGKIDLLQRRVKELEVLKKHIIGEINQLEAYSSSLQMESNKLKNQIEKNQREFSSLGVEKKAIERQINQLTLEVNNLQANIDQSSNYLDELNKEKRSLDINGNLAKAEITQLKSQIDELQEQKQDLENNLTLLNRLRPQLEEKLYEMRLQLQELELQESKKNEILKVNDEAKNILEMSSTSLDDTIAQQKAEFRQLQEQITILQTERDQLQKEIWELLQQFDNVAQTPLDEQVDSEMELFPFAELIQEVNDMEIVDELPPEWNLLLQNLPPNEIEVLKIILQEDSNNEIDEKSPEQELNMPSLLINSINKRANNIFGKLIIELEHESPIISPEHRNNVSKLVHTYDILSSKQSSSN